MPTKLVLFFSLLFLLLSSGLKAIDAKEEMSRASCICFSGNIYVYGFEQKGSELYLKVTCFSGELQKINETKVLLENNKADKFHPIAADTLHDYLNFTVQRIDNDKTAKVIRLSNTLVTIAVINEAPISRINSFAAFDDEKLYTKSDLFVIRPGLKDSANMFFLQKVHLIDSTKIFEYELDWQFGFDKNKYKYCHIIDVNNKFVFVYANVLAGIKKGQWVLLIDLNTGEVDKACKLNEGMDNYELLYSAHCYNKQTKELVIAGAKLLKPKGNQLDLSINKLKALNVFICNIDSVGKMKEKKFDFIPIPVELGKEKEFKNYVLKTSKILFRNEEYTLFNEVLAEATPKLYKTYGYIFTQLVRDEYGALKTGSAFFDASYKDSKLNFAKQVTNNYEVEKGETDKLFYKAPLYTAFSGFSWDLQYTDKIMRGIGQHQNNTTGKITFYSYSLKDKKWENKDLLCGEKTLKSKCIVVNTKKYILFNLTPASSDGAVSEGCTLELKEY